MPLDNQLLAQVDLFLHVKSHKMPEGDVDHFCHQNPKCNDWVKLSMAGTKTAPVRGTAGPHLNH